MLTLKVNLFWVAFLQNYIRGNNFIQIKRNIGTELVRDHSFSTYAKFLEFHTYICILQKQLIIHIRGLALFKRFPKIKSFVEFLQYHMRFSPFLVPECWAFVKSFRNFFSRTPDEVLFNRRSIVCYNSVLCEMKINDPFKVRVLRNVLYVPLFLLFKNMACVYPRQMLIHGFRDSVSVRSLRGFCEDIQRFRAKQPWR